MARLGAARFGTHEIGKHDGIIYVAWNGHLYNNLEGQPGQVIMKKSSMDQGMTWSKLKIPFVKKVNADLNGYATDKAIDGLFVLVAKEESNIRENPVARSTELLKRVFE